MLLEFERDQREDDWKVDVDEFKDRKSENLLLLFVSLVLKVLLSNEERHKELVQVVDPGDDHVQDNGLFEGILLECFFAENVGANREGHKRC